MMNPHQDGIIPEKTWVKINDKENKYKNIKLSFIKNKDKIDLEQQQYFCV